MLMLLVFILMLMMLGVYRVDVGSDGVHGIGVDGIDINCVYSVDADDGIDIDSILQVLMLMMC